MRVIKSIIIGIALSFAVPVWSAQTVHQSKRVQKAPVIDGVIAPDEWDGLSNASDFIDPVTGKPVDEQTEVWFGYDAEYIYVAARMHDSKPSEIVAKQTQPGTSMEGEDTFAVKLDPFHSLQWDGVSTFVVNALGTQRDEFSGGRSSKREWRGEWDAKASVDEFGWTAEMRIPWKILHLPAKGTRDIVLNMVRNHQRPHISSWLANIGSDFRWEKSAIWQGVEVPEIQSNRIRFQGYISPEWRKDKFNLNAGLDARYNVTSQYTLLGTIKPDFVNVEQQVAGIEFTRSERILEDNRPFFSEGNDYFWLTGSYTFARMFYSRRIGEFDYGAKGFGRIDANNDVSALVAQTGNDRTDAVFHYVHRFDPKNSMSLYGTSVDSPDTDNKAYGGSVNLNKGHWGSQFQLAQVKDNGSVKDTGAVAFEYNGPKLFSVIRHIWIDPGFNPGLGYVSYDDKKGFESYSEYNTDLRTGAFRYQGASLWLQKYDKYDGSNKVETAQLDVRATTRNGTSFGLGYQSEKFEEEYDGILSGSIGLNVDDSHKNAYISGSTGTRGGIASNYISAGGKYRVANKLDVGLSYAVLDYQGTAEQTIFTIGWEIDPKRSLTARTVWTDGHTNAYFAYRSAGFTGLDFYIIVGDPNAEEWTNRIAAKLMWAW